MPLKLKNNFITKKVQKMRKKNNIIFELSDDQINLF